MKAMDIKKEIEGTRDKLNILIKNKVQRKTLIKTYAYNSFFVHFKWLKVATKIISN